MQRQEPQHEAQVADPAAPHHGFCRAQDAAGAHFREVQQQKIRHGECEPPGKHGGQADDGDDRDDRNVRQCPALGEKIHQQLDREHSGQFPSGHDTPYTDRRILIVS